MRLIKGNVERIANAPMQILKLKAEGYKPVDDMADNVKAEMPQNIAELDVKALKAVAKEKGLEGYQSLNKAELLEVLKDVV